jgi:hypothetical protein
MEASMTMNLDDPRGQQFDQLFAELDARGETAAPDELDLEDTAGPEDEDDVQDTAAAELEAEEGDTGDLRALAARGKRALSLEEVRALQARARARGKKVGKVQAKRRPAAPARPQPPKNLVLPGEGVRTLIRRWDQDGKEFTINQAGSYYYATEIRCKCEGNAERAYLRIPAGRYSFFDKALDDDTTYLGNNGRVTVDITNFQRPSKNTSHGQDFLVQSISMMEANLRVRYEDSDIGAVMGLETAASALRGNAWLWDDAGVFLPAEIFHDFNGENLLYRAVRRSGALYFVWEKARVGGSANRREILVDHLRNIPDVRVRSLARTSGGAAVLPVPDGYVFCDDPERSEDGAFSAVLHLPSDVIFPIKPIDLGAGKKAKPLEVGLYVQLNLNGIGFQLARRGQATR